MAKELIPEKIIINFEDGAFKDGILRYRIRENGALGRDRKSIGIKNMGFSLPNLNSILKKIKDKTKEAENITESEV